MRWRPVELLDVNGVSLATEQLGDASDPTLVLVCGGSSAKEWWDDGLGERLAAGGLRVVRYDLRDTGQSTTVPPGEATYTGTDLVDDLASLIGALDAAPAHVWGMSMGGGIAQGLATRHPEMVASLVLQSTSPAGPTAHDGPRLPGPEAAVLATFAEELPEPDWDDAESVASYVVAVERPYAGTIPFDAERVGRTGARVVERGGPQRSGGNHVRAGEGDHVVHPASFAVPTLVIHGDADPMFPLEHGRRLAEIVPDAQLLVVPGLGHQYPPPETWDLVVPAVLAHTRSTTAGRPA